MTNLTSEQEKGFKSLLTLIETTHTLISNGLFPGIASQSVAQVLGWLSQYHKDVKYQLPVTEEKPANEGDKPALPVSEPIPTENVAETKAGA